MSKKEESGKQEEINYWKEVGERTFKEGNYLAALEAYETVTLADPENSEAWKGMATAFSLLDKPYDALNSLDQAIEINPSDIESLEIKQLILKKLVEENQEALNRLKTVQSDKKNQKLI
ncbi:MAG: tetratricopeptide repeat protein [Methanobacterium sp.]|nr:tetratricopeptide repeat protein [Methanobacterium sp.]